LQRPLGLAVAEKIAIVKLYGGKIKRYSRRLDFQYVLEHYVASIHWQFGRVLPG
jgi:hypothetical protein